MNSVTLTSEFRAQTFCGCILAGVDSIWFVRPFTATERARDFCEADSKQWTSRRKQTRLCIRELNVSILSIVRGVLYLEGVLEMRSRKKFVSQKKKKAVASHILAIQNHVAEAQKRFCALRCRAQTHFCVTRC